MGIQANMRVEAQLTTGIWTDLTPDTNAVSGLQVFYGIQGNGPTDCVAGTGEAAWVQKNHAGNSGAQQGYYSPLHASKRSGWAFGIPAQIVFSHGNDSAQSVSTLTRSGTTATATTAAAHGYATSDYVTISGAGEEGYNGTYQITVTGGSTLTYTVACSPATPATGTITARKAYVKHRGKIRVIDPDAGIARQQLVRVTSYDGIRDLAESDLREVALQVGATEAECVDALLDALPAASQPVARSLDTGVDTFPYAFDDLEGGQKALGIVKDVCLSSFALAFIRGDGTFRLLSRNTRATGSSSYTFTNTMHGLGVPTDERHVFNLVRVTIRPRTISAAATEELYALPTGDSLEIPHGETITLWTSYSDPNDRQVTVGGAAVVTALVGGTHYSANSQADGLGSDLTASISATLEPFASVAKWTLTNNHASSTAYIVPPLKVIGKALRNPGPKTFEATSTQAYGTRPLSLDLKYQADSVIAQSYATFLEAQYNSLASQLEYIEFLANDSSDFLTQALAREPGDIITVTETVTGVSTDATIQSVSLEVTPGPMIVCRWGLAPTAPFQAWVLGIVGRSELGVTTRLGF